MIKGMSRKSFIKSITPHALKVQDEYGIPASIVIAQAVLESDNGESPLSSNYHNHFGMKAGASWDGATAVLSTKEYAGGWVSEDARFRSYANIEDSFMDYGRMVTTHSAWSQDLARSGGDPEQFVRGMVTGELQYATDPGYVEKVMGIVNAHNLTTLDDTSGPTGYQGPTQFARGADGAVDSATGLVRSLMNGSSQDELNREERQAMADMLGHEDSSGLFFLLSILLVLGGATEEQYDNVMAAFGFGGDEHDRSQSASRGYSDEGYSRGYGVGRTLDGANQSANKIEDLHPAIQGAATAVIADLQAQGIPVRVMSTFRSVEEQDRLYNSGRGVTRVRGGGSYHNYALAFDIAPVEVLSDSNWDPENPVWDKVGAAMKRHGFEWGGDWRSFQDRPHAQVAGISIAQLRHASRGVDGHVVLPESVIARYSGYNQNTQLAAAQSAASAVVAGVVMQTEPDAANITQADAAAVATNAGVRIASEGSLSGVMSTMPRTFALPRLTTAI